MESTEHETAHSRVFVVLNPNSGTCDRDTVVAAFDRYFGGPVTTYRVHEPVHDDALADRVSEALAEGCDLVVAAGGDGTISGVAQGLLGTDTPLGILPLGTANVLARELGIPVDLEGACALLAGPHSFTKIDAMTVDGKTYFTQVGIGIDALMIRDTANEHKRRFGRLAYLWTAARSLVGFRPRQFLITVDGREVRKRASQVLVANSGMLGQPPFRWGPDIRPDDGVIDVCVVRVRSLVDYARIGWNVVRNRHRQDPGVSYLKARRGVVVATVSPKPLPVQGDGEIIGETPVEVKLVPGAVRVAVPRRA